MKKQETNWADFSAALRQKVRFDLFTVLDVNRAEGLVQRGYSSDEINYPSGGIKRLMDSSWAAHVIRAGQTFRSRDQEEFRGAFSDHALLEGLGLTFALNVPRMRDGVVCQTINLLRGGIAFSESEASAIVMALAALPD